MAGDASRNGQRQRTVDELRELRDRLEAQHAAEQERRRFEDEVREELREAHAKTILVSETSEPITDGEADSKIKPKRSLQPHDSKRRRRFRKGRTKAKR
jgi:hypothetical protein